MRRSEDDVGQLLAGGIRIRLCKGAYKEPEEIAFQKKADVDANYVKLMKILLKSGVYHGLATHDEAIINSAKAFATGENISRDSFEFQMLYGIRRDLQRRLVARRMADAGLHSLRHRVVSVFHAPPGGTSGQRAIRRQKFTAPLTLRQKTFEKKCGLRPSGRIENY